MDLHLQVALIQGQAEVLAEREESMYPRVVTEEALVEEALVATQVMVDKVVRGLDQASDQAQLAPVVVAAVGAGEMPETVVGE